jgi:hypothetical protein
MSTDETTTNGWVSSLIIAIGMAAIAFFYLRLESIWPRTAVLTISIFLIITVLAVTIFTDWEEFTQPEIIATLSLALMGGLVIVLPALLGCAHELFEPSQRSQPDSRMDQTP